MASTRHKAKKRKPSPAGQIRQMVERIVRQFAPDKIILFGSHARGCAGPDSDVDLLIVMEVQGSRREQAVEIGVALHDIRVPKDLIVVTPEEFEWRKDVIGTIEWPAWREGKVLYARTGIRPDVLVLPSTCFQRPAIVAQPPYSVRDVQSRVPFDRRWSWHSDRRRW